MCTNLKRPPLREGPKKASSKSVINVVNIEDKLFRRDKKYCYLM